MRIQSAVEVATYCTQLTFSEINITLFFSPRTKDERLILAHDDTFTRLALNKHHPTSSQKIQDLTFKELMALPLTSASRPPLLLDVLSSAETIGADHAQLVIEIKPGNEAAASALAQLLAQRPEFWPCIAVIMRCVRSLSSSSEGRYHRGSLFSCSCCCRNLPLYDKYHTPAVLTPTPSTSSDRNCSGPPLHWRQRRKPITQLSLVIVVHTVGPSRSRLVWTHLL